MEQPNRFPIWQRPSIDQSRNTDSQPADDEKERITRKPRTGILGWILGYWNGEQALAKAYWVTFSLIVNFLVPTILLSLVIFTKNVLIAYCVYASLAICSTWGIVGLWRSASNHPERGGSRFWAIICKTLAVISALYSVLSLVSVFTL